MFTQRWKADLRKQLAEAQITVKEYSMRLNIQATIWLGMYLDMDIQFRANKNISHEKAKYAEDRVQRLRSAHGLEPELIKQVQVAAVQVVAFLRSGDMLTLPEEMVQRVLDVSQQAGMSNYRNVPISPESSPGERVRSLADGLSTQHPTIQI